MVRGWRRRFSTAAATVAVILLITTAAAGAESLGSQSRAGNAGPEDSPSLNQQSGSSEFADKATGDWWGVRRCLKKAGITIDASLQLEGFKNFHGGLRTSPWVGASTFDLSLSFDTEPLLNWKGGKFYVDLEDHAGRNPSQVLVGDLQIFDKQNTIPYLQFFELWFQQKLFDDKLRLKIGKVDANTEFSVIENGLVFLNSSSQVSPTVFLLPTTPDPMPSVNVFFTPWKFFYAAFGAYYANRSEGFGNLVGKPQNIQASNFGAFLIGEAGLRWPRTPILGGGGNLKFGYWRHTGTFSRFAGSQQPGVQGYYAILDQTLWQPVHESPKGRGVRAFLVYGNTDPGISPIDWHLGGGVTWTGPLAARPQDIAGFGPQYAHISPQAGLPYSFELALEWFYRLQITPWAMLMPDLQYIIHSGGQYPSALVGTLRMKVNF